MIKIYAITWVELMRKMLIIFLVIGCGTLHAQSTTKVKKGVNQGTVIEVVTFKLKQGVTADEFRPLDKAVELQHVAKQPGFISRESAAGDDGEWLVIVHWRSVKDAEASMASFSSAPATEQFMSKIDAKSMIMKRYVKD